MVGMAVMAVSQFERGQHMPRHADWREVRRGFEQFSSEMRSRLYDVHSMSGLLI